jgi:hypothetical protein
MEIQTGLFNIIKIQSRKLQRGIEDEKSRKRKT